MNDIIKTFEAQCTDTVEIYNDVTGITHEREFFDKERFAELIVRECAEICYHHSQAAGGVDTAFGYGYKDCGNDIKQHFGVEL